MKLVTINQITTNMSCWNIPWKGISRKAFLQMDEQIAQAIVQRIHQDFQLPFALRLATIPLSQDRAYKIKGIQYLGATVSETEACNTFEALLDSYLQKENMALKVAEIISHSVNHQQGYWAFEIARNPVLNERKLALKLARLVSRQRSYDLARSIRDYVLSKPDREEEQLWAGISLLRKSDRLYVSYVQKILFTSYPDVFEKCQILLNSKADRLEIVNDILLHPALNQCDLANGFAVLTNSFSMYQLWHIERRADSSLLTWLQLFSSLMKEGNYANMMVKLEKNQISEEKKPLQKQFSKSFM